MNPCGISRFLACLGVAFGAMNVLGQTEAGRHAAPVVAPMRNYDLNTPPAADVRPASGNVTSKPAAPPASAAEFDPASDEGALTVLGASINGAELRGETIVAVRDGVTLVPVEDMKRWRLLYSATPIMIELQPFVALASVTGLTFRIDKERQQLQITVPIEAFERTSLSGDRHYLPPSQAARTAFVNYDLSVQRVSKKVIGDAFLELGASGDIGLVENTMTVGNNPAGHNLIRLDTFAVHDDPSGLTRLTLGDTLTHSSSWATPVRFGGIKWGTDFSLQPGFLSFPTPTFNGSAALPSNVQLYVNNVLNYQGQVQPGPFTLNRLPVVSGAGDVSVVVKDALGVEHRVVSSYYVSTALLRPGLSDFSIEAGTERNRYGIQSFAYGRAFVAGSIRHGFLPGLTLETRAEGSANLQDAGAGVAALLGSLGEVGGSVAASNGPKRSGTLYRLYASRISRSWSLSFSYQSSSRNFAQLGQGLRLDRPRTILQATVGANNSRLGSVTGNISYLRMQDGTRTRVSSFNYNHQLGTFAYFSGFVLRTEATDSKPGRTIGASLSIPLGTRRSAYVQADSDSRHVEVQQARPDDKGWGYRVAVSQGETDQQEAELDYRGRAIDLTANVARFNGQVAERVLASGGLVWSGSSVLPTRRLNNSFAIVNVGGGERGVRVFQENRRVATTNGAGIAIVTDLRPYEANRLSVAPDDLKLESTIHDDNLIVVPRFLAGVRAHFQIISGHAGTVLIMLPDGSPLEAGLVLSDDNGGTFYSGFDGEVFIDNITEGKVLVARRPVPCRVTLPAVPKGVELPRIGPLTCLPSVPAE